MMKLLVPHSHSLKKQHLLYKQVLSGAYDICVIIYSLSISSKQTFGLVWHMFSFAVCLRE